jgi:hypothetical protein
MNFKRDLKFRAWGGNEKRKYFVYFTLNEVKDDYIQDIKTQPDGSHHLVYKESIIAVHQFTGLRDVKGQDIYEGDVLNIGGVLYLMAWDVKAMRFGLFTLSAHTQGVSPHLPVEDYYFAGGGQAVFWENTGVDNPVEKVGNILENPEYIKPPTEKDEEVF